MSPDIDISKFEIFPWSRIFETGNKHIDTQHKSLVNLINEFARKLAENKGFLIDDTLKQLADYAANHFADEEKLWRKNLSDTSVYDEHQKEHQSFLPRIMQIRNRAGDENPDELLKFLVRWLAFHIVDSDKKMSIMANEVKNGMDESQARTFAEEKIGGTTSNFIESILVMYEKLSLNALILLKERSVRIQAEKKLIELNRELEALSIRDQLTGIFNRRYFEQVFEKEFLRARREQRLLSLFIFDVDSFKMYNDKYGHLAGDGVLKQVAAAISESCRRPEDFAFRIGGEEFAIITSNLDTDKARLFGDRIRAEVENLGLEHRYSTDKNVVTISGGFAGLIPTFDDSRDKLFKMADQQLYRAKEAGRNRICC